ncbi:hypothetical protein [Nocardioides sp. AE5]|uniref:hypothetical protein n=1 Tax=Nocardioides sp. AE5 TaxID=2962573 RepID=UPI0037CB00B2
MVPGPGTGELQVRGPGVFAGYLGDPAATARSMDEGWLRTGDLAARDTDGGSTIVDRLKNIYISGGENVAPAEVEVGYAPRTRSSPRQPSSAPPTQSGARSGSPSWWPARAPR